MHFIHPSYVNGQSVEAVLSSWPLCGHVPLSTGQPLCSSVPENVTCADCIELMARSVELDLTFKAACEYPRTHPGLTVGGYCPRCGAHEEDHDA